MSAIGSLDSIPPPPRFTSRIWRKEPLEYDHGFVATDAGRFVKFAASKNHGRYAP